MWSKEDHIRLIECPRDAIQGIPHFIPTAKKIDYINLLFDSGLFFCIDFGSFVSPKAVPQMQDTIRVLDGIEKKNSTKLLAIVLNEKGAEIARPLDKIDFLGYPFSISETFQQRNANCTIQESFERVKAIRDMVEQGRQQLVIYISMAFGNPYADPWSTELVLTWIERLAALGVRHFSIADTTGEASAEDVGIVFQWVKATFPDLLFSIHLHSRPESAVLKIEAAYEAGCRTFEGTFLGYGGCPLAQDDLVGNIPTEFLLNQFEYSHEVDIQILQRAFQHLVMPSSV